LALQSLPDDFSRRGLISAWRMPGTCLANLLPAAMLHHHVFCRPAAVTDRKACLNVTVCHATILCAADAEIQIFRAGNLLTVCHPDRKIVPWICNPNEVWAICRSLIFCHPASSCPGMQVCRATILSAGDAENRI